MLRPLPLPNTGGCLILQCHNSHVLTVPSHSNWSSLGPLTWGYFYSMEHVGKSKELVVSFFQTCFLQPKQIHFLKHALIWHEKVWIFLILLVNQLNVCFFKVFHQFVCVIFNASSFFFFFKAVWSQVTIAKRKGIWLTLVC